MTAPAERLYGFDDDEYGADDPAAVLERFIEDTDEPFGSLACPDIVEWSVRPSTSHLPSTSLIVDFLSEWVGENGELSNEDGWEQFDEAIHSRSGLIEELRESIGSAVGWRQADKALRRLPVAWTAEGGWTIDGEPAWTEVPG